MLKAEWKWRIASVLLGEELSNRSIVINSGGSVTEQQYSVCLNS